MTIKINVTYDGFHRVISIDVTADAGKRLSRVRTTYDGFVLGDEPTTGSHYENTYQKQEGISPGWTHKVVVDAWHSDGTSDSGVKQWQDQL